MTAYKDTLRLLQEGRTYISSELEQAKRAFVTDPSMETLERYLNVADREGLFIANMRQIIEDDVKRCVQDWTTLNATGSSRLDRVIKSLARRFGYTDKTMIEQLSDLVYTVFEAVDRRWLDLKNAFRRDWEMREL